MNQHIGCLSKREREVVGSFVAELREKLGDEILSIRLFGSKARGDSNEESDIDIFILVKEKTPDIRDRLAGVATDYDIEYGLPLSTVLYDLFEYQRNKELGSFFFESVEREGIAL